MKLPPPAEQYRDFRLSKLNEPRYRHLWLLLFWPVYICRYVLLEHFNPAVFYHPIHCALDDFVPFQEGFVLFYVVWYVFIGGMHLYTLLFDVESFKKYSKFLIISMSVSTAIFLLYPSCQNLRPAQFPRDNFLTNIVAGLYAADTNTNVFPSEHVIGSLAVLAAALHTKGLKTRGMIALIAVLAVTISLSTAFIKQHSVLDGLAAVPICAAAYWLCYVRKGCAS